MLRVLTRRGDRIEAGPPAAEAPLAVHTGPVSIANSEPSISAIRETIDLVEADVAAMIRDVLQACHAVRRGTQSAIEGLAAIRKRSESLAPMSRDAEQGAVQ